MMSKAGDSPTTTDAPKQPRLLPIPVIENPSEAFKSFLARRAELRGADDIAGSIAGYEPGRAAEEVAGKAFDRMWAVIDTLVARTLTRDEDIVELAIVLADRDMGYDGKSEFPHDATLGLINAIFALYASRSETIANGGGDV